MRDFIGSDLPGPEIAQRVRDGRREDGRLPRYEPAGQALRVDVDPPPDPTDDGLGDLGQLRVVLARDVRHGQEKIEPTIRATPYDDVPRLHAEGDRYSAAAAELVG